MDQLKEHYEKIILGLAMLALVYVAYGIVMDPSKESIEKQKQARSRPDFESKKEMPEMDMSDYRATLARLENAKALNLGNPHNLFNPVQWRVARDGTVLKVESGNEIGAGAIKLSDLIRLVARTAASSAIQPPREWPTTCTPSKSSASRNSR